jgi:hypothetical protein
MEIKINPMDYVSEDEIKGSIISAIRSKTSQDIERILSNLAHDTADSFIDSIVDAEYKGVVKGKTIENLNKIDYTYHLLRKRNSWEKDDSVAQKIMDQTISDNKELIRSKIQFAIENFDYDEYFANELGALIVKVFQKKLE